MFTACRKSSRPRLLEGVKQFVHVDLVEVGVGLGEVSCDRKGQHRNQQAQDGDHDHEFDKGETRACAREHDCSGNRKLRAEEARDPTPQTSPADGILSTFSNIYFRLRVFIYTNINPAPAWTAK